MKLYFVDVESTGLDLDNDDIIQLSIIKKDGQNISSFNELCYTDINIEEHISAIHNITNHQLSDKYWAFETDGFIELEKNNSQANYFISHSNELDVGLLKKDGLELKMNIIDTDKCARHLLKESNSYKLESLIYQYNLNEKEKEIANLLNIEKFVAHDALTDAVWHYLLFDFLLQKVDGNINELLRLSTEPILLEKVTFGKNKNKTFKELLKRQPLDLIWMYNHIATEWKDLEYTVEYWLKTNSFSWNQAKIERKQLINKLRRY
jgi:exodeoxyribonuclease X